MSIGWYTMQIFAQFRETAEAHLKRQKFASFFPMMVTKTNKKQEVLETCPLFKGYGFVQFDPEKDQWLSINSTRGVVRLLPKWALMPVPMPDGFVQYFIDHDPLFEDSIVEVFEAFFPGSEVRVRRGVAEGRTGVVVAAWGKFIEVAFEDRSWQKNVHNLRIATTDLVPV